MTTRLLVVFASLAGVPASFAQPVLYGVGANGDLVRLDAATGAGTLVGNSGVGANGATSDHAGHILSGGGNADQIIAIDPATGAGSVFLNTTGRPFGFGIRGMAISPTNVLYVVLSSADTSVIDTLATIDLVSGAYAVIGPTGRTDIQSLACTPAGVLYAVGTSFGGRLYQIDATTGAASVVGTGGGYGGDDQAMEFLADGSAVSCRAGLRSVDLTTGAATLIGPTGFADIRGLALVVPAVIDCYANCDGSTAAPVLNVQDFTCFLQKFAGGDPYANCDGSTGAPVLNVQDFTCFLQKYAAGCP